MNMLAVKILIILGLMIFGMTLFLIARDIGSLNQKVNELERQNKVLAQNLLQAFGLSAEVDKTIADAVGLTDPRMREEVTNGTKR
jgi:hypothetical protein